MSKGSANAAKNAQGVAQSYSQQYKNAAGQQYNELFPFLSNELKNPQGYGQDALNQMLTQGGEAVSGATAAADENARLNATRTGNTASLPAAIAENARNAMRQQSSNAIGVNLQNENLKQQQQQQAAQAMQNLYSGNTQAALNSLGLQSQLINDWTQGKAAANAGILAPFQVAAGLGQTAMGTWG